jgi:hypothetical protein
MALKKGVDKSKDSDSLFKEDSPSTASSKTSVDKKSVEAKAPVKEFDPQSMLDAMAKMQNTIDDLKSKGGSDSEEADWVDDYMEEPAIYFCFSSWKGLYSEKRRGKLSMPPNGGVKFESLYRYKKRHGNTWKVISVSQYTCRSKAEKKWLEESPEFNFGFFPNIDSARGVDASFAQKQLEQHHIVSKMGDHAVVERAGAEGIAIKTADLDELRRELTSVLADKAIKTEKQRTAEGLKRNTKENAEVRNIPSSLQAQESSESGEGVY